MGAKVAILVDIDERKAVDCAFYFQKDVHTVVVAKAYYHFLFVILQPTIKPIQMNTQKALSLIIPTYNMEALLEHTLASLLVARNLDLLEVVVVNDGSTDRSPAIARDFCNRYPGVFRLVDKANGHYGSCINAGLKVVTGKYIKVLDADDSFDTAHLDELLGRMSETDVDLFVSQFVTITPDGERGRPRRLHIPAGEVLQMARIYKALGRKGTWMHELAYNRSVFAHLDYHQTEGILYTDIQWGLVPMTQVKTVYYFDKVVYLYLLGRDGQSMDIEVHRQHLRDEYLCLKGVVDSYAKTTFCCPETRRMLRHKLYRRLCWSYRECMTTYGEPCAQPLLDFDAHLRQTDHSLYRQLGRKLLSVPLVPVPYIKMWRSNPRGRMLDRALRLYMYLHKK